MNKNLKAALEYQKLGYSIFPLQTIKNGRCSCNNWQTCDRQGKHPRTAHGLKDATTDKAQIETWFKSQPDSNIGLCTGAVNGNITIDIDPKEILSYLRWDVSTTATGAAEAVISLKTLCVPEAWHRKRRKCWRRNSKA